MCPLVTTEERCRYSAYLACVRKRGCVGDSNNTVWPHILQKRVQLQTQKPRSGHPRSTNILRLHAYLISLPLLAIARFFPTQSSSHHRIPPQLPLLTLSDFSIIKLPSYFFERQKVSPEIQDLLNNPETALMAWKTDLLQQFWDERGNPKSTLSCHILNEVKTASSKNPQWQFKHFIISRCLEEQKP